MPLDSQIHRTALATFIASLADVPWLAHAGDRDDAAIVADDLVDAWDGWNSEMMKVWSPQTHALERVAVDELGEDGVRAVFESVAHATGDRLVEAIEHFYDTRSADETGADRGMWREWLDALQRDLAWAAVEAVLDRPGFFTELLRYQVAVRNHRECGPAMIEHFEFQPLV
jgi:hypothetical protein